MGFRFRKSTKVGPFRITASKSGISYSVGRKGYRVTKQANGKVRKTVSIPGTGISYSTTTGSTKKNNSSTKVSHQNSRANARKDKTGIHQSFGVVIAKIVLGAIFIFSAFALLSSDGFSTFIVFMVIGFAFIAWGYLPYHSAKAMRDKPLKSDELSDGLNLHQNLSQEESSFHEDAFYVVGVNYL